MELYDVPKSKKHKDELDERISLMLEIQEQQGGNLLLNRYGYNKHMLPKVFTSTIKLLEI